MSVSIASVVIRPVVVQGTKIPTKLELSRIYKGDPGSITPEFVALADQVKSDKSAADSSALAAQQAAQLAADQAAAAAQQQVSAAVQAAAQSAQAASDQATIATQKAAAASATNDSVTQTAGVVATNKAATDASLASAQLAAQIAATQAGAASAAQTAALSARDQSNAARDAAIAAWSASMSPAESLPAISKLMHAGAVVKAIIYDTSKDSDGGQWRKRCQSKSWYSEAVNTVWLGQQASELAARGDNLFMSPDDLTNANWWVAGATAGGPSLNKLSNDGTVRLQKVLDSNVNTSHQIYQNFPSQPQATTMAVQYTFLKGELSKLVMFFGGAGFSTTPQASVDLVAGTVTPSRGAYASIAPDPVTGGFIVTMWAQTTAAGAVTCGIGLMNAAAASVYAGDGVSGLYMSNPKLIYPGKLASTYSASPEVVSNGQFANGSLAGWAQSSSWGATATAAAGEMQVTTTASSGRMVIPIQCTVGAIYALTATSRVISGNQAAIGVSNSANGASINASGWIFNTSSNPSTATIAFIATAATMYIAAGDNNAQAAGVVNGFSGISVKQVTQVITPYIPYSAQVGQYYQSTADGKFYVLGQTYGAAETLRGNVRDFPEQVAVIVEAGRVVIYDLTQPACPMWMVFSWALGGVFTSVVALNGVVHVGCANGLIHYKFIADATDFRQTGNYRTLSGLTPGNRSGSGTLVAISGNAFIVAIPVNDVTATVLDGAPADANSGLAIPTIVVSTNGGVSVIKQDGTVSNWLTTGKGYIKTAYINRQGAIAATGGESVAWSTFFKRSLPTGTDNSVDYQFDALTIPARLGTNSQYGKMETVIDAGANRALASLQQAPIGGLTLMRDNPATPAAGMVAYIQSTFSSGWLVGDVRGAWLADVMAEQISAVELVSNGGFDTDLTSWVQYPMNGGAFAVNAGRLQITAGAGQYAQVQQTINGLVVGKAYQLKFDVIPGTFAVPVVQYSFGTAITVGSASGLGQIVPFIATATSVTLTLAIGAAAATGQTILFDNISVKQVVADRSVKGNSLNIVGSLTKAAAAVGAATQKFSGFAAGVNYLQQPYSANLDYGTGDFYYAFWMDSTSSGCKMSRGSGAVAGSFGIVNSGAGGTLYFQQWTGAAMANVVGATIPAGVGLCIVQRVGTAVQVWWNGALIQSGTSANTMSCAGAEFHIGNLQYGVQGDGGWTALLRTGAISLSPDQIAKMYADELPLFQPGAQCTIDGTSSGISALAYDDVCDLLHVSTSWGRSSFRGLLRVDSEATSVGIVSSLAGNQGARLIAGATGCRIYQPAMLLRDELRREEAARRALGQRPQFFEFDAIAAQTAFVIPKGYTAKAVYSAGILQREGSTKSYTRSFDGFYETINFAVAPGAAVWVSIMCVRS